VAVQETKRLLPRGVPYPDFHLVEPAALAASGVMAEARDRARPWRDRSLVNIGPELGGYPMDELELIVSDLVGALRTGRLESANRPREGEEALALETGEFHIVDLGRNATGFPRFTVTCAEPVRLFVTFDEILTNGDVDWKRLGCVSVLTYDLEPGTHALEAFEPYTLRGLKFIAARGACTIRDVALRTYENPETGAARFACSDPRLMEIFTAAKHTFAQNALDAFMDCPHRERAGWLCDSYFTAEAARHISGNTSVERVFLENYAVPDRFEHLPEGMLPMCYPADHNDGVFIPNWALWCVVQLGTYLDRGGDRALVDAMRPKVLALFEYFKPFENGDGLLEKLESWVFVEWSKANEFVQDVNYPSNMLYAGALSTAARLYELPGLEERAEAVRRVVREQSFNGRFFVDNALRKADGSLEVTENHSEVCQYFAFFFGVATPETHGELQRRLVEEFGPGRAEKGLHPEVHPANMFIGHMLRLELLSRWRENVKVMESLDGYFHHMAQKTGTLWENDGAYASLNHGFASHAAVSLYRDVLGVVELDPVARRVRVHVPDVPLAWCEGTIPVGKSAVYVRWERLDAGGIRVMSRVPGDFGAEYTSALDLAELDERHAPQAF
jgi:alpha-L-rhamnosidase